MLHEVEIGSKPELCSCFVGVPLSDFSLFLNTVFFPLSYFPVREMKNCCKFLFTSDLLLVKNSTYYMCCLQEIFSI